MWHLVTLSSTLPPPPRVLSYLQEKDSWSSYQCPAPRSHLWLNRVIHCQRYQSEDWGIAGDDLSMSHWVTELHCKSILLVISAYDIIYKHLSLGFESHFKYFGVDHKWCHANYTTFWSPLPAISLFRTHKLWPLTLYMDNALIQDENGSW